MSKITTTKNICAQESKILLICICESGQGKKKPLEPAYEGPFPVLERNYKYFLVNINN